MNREKEKEIMEQLTKPFGVELIEWRISNISKDKSKGLALPYVKTRAIQNRLDEVFTPFGWSNHFSDWKNNNAQICTISVNWNGKTIEKQDGAGDTAFESIKGGLSDSFKRCARMWGIGRYLTELEPMWVSIDQYKKIEKSEYDRLHNAYNQFINSSYSNKAAARPESQAQAHPQSKVIKTKKDNNVQSNVNNKFSVAVKKAEENKTVSASIPAQKLDYIEKLIEKSKTNINSILEYYSISSLQELTNEASNDLISKLLKKK